MVFSSLFFLYLFLPLCVVCYAVCKKARNTVLLLFSLVFYAFGEPVYVFLLIISGFVNYLCGLAVERFRGNKGSAAAAAFAVIFDILLLGVFKYSGFIIENINAVTGLGLSVPDIRLPIGISFFTFQMISYIIDCHWETVRVQRSFPKFLMYVSLFPQLIAGPIVRYSTIESEIDNRSTTVNDLYQGISRFAVGLAKKVIIANNLSTVVSTLFDGELSRISAVGLWLGAAIYAMQVYFDFSGYSDMAIGMGRIFGFHFDENFNYPFICKDVSEFWHRWHISLSTFFRDYLLYVPILGKRRKYGGLILVWFCTGLWHGAAWNYIIWGLYFGFFILTEQLMGRKRIKKIPAFIRHIYSKAVIITGFGIFYFEDINRLGEFLKGLVGINGNGLTDRLTHITFINNICLILTAFLCMFPFVKLIRRAARKSDGIAFVKEILAIPINVSLLAVSSIMLVDATNNPFLYFRF